MTLARRALACSLWLVACGGGPQTTTGDDTMGALERYEAERGVYSEFLAFDEVSAQLPAIAELKLALALAIRPGDIGGSELAALLRDARGRGVPVRAWLLLEDDDGYWPGAGNLEAFAAQVDAFWAWNEAEGLGVEWIVVDMEPPLEQSDALAAALEGGSLLDVLPILMANRDLAAHEEARAAWVAAVEGWQARGIKVALVALPYLLDDAADGDDDLEDMFESPVRGVPWDEAAFMVYQNLYSDPSGARLGAGLVRSYAETAVAQHGPRAAVALGIIGTVGKNTTSRGYEAPAQLAADLGAAAQAGVAMAHLFSLDGALAEGDGDPTLWLGQAPASDAIPVDDPKVVEARALIAALDSL
ncbi:MAG: hypothetical protein KC636_14500 [Myxococcales bacterium]|nr:hypothetical protein [Myxococcales bacterium]